jgi:methionyl-tRNA formyltransferase
MRIVFMGTPDFAVPSLEILVKHGYNVVGVVTVPDKPAGRGQQLQESAVKKFAKEKGIKVLQPVKLKDPAFIAELKALHADLQIVVAFRMLPEEVWNMPRLGTYNLHGSLLPKYRGAAPINWAIINGEKESGVTTFKLKHEIDTGNILFRQSVPITETTTAGDLHDQLMTVGADLVLKTVQAIESGKAELKPQDDARAIHAPKIFKEDCRIKWDRSCKEVYNFVRGLSPYPGAFSEFKDANGKLVSLKLFSCAREESSQLSIPGQLQTDHKNHIKIACKDGFIAVQELQLQGKKKMTTAEFLRGYRFPDNTILI